MTNEKMFSDVKQFSLIFIPINWLICLVVSTVLYFTLGKTVMFGYLVGYMTSFLTFGLLMKNTSNSLQPSKNSVRARIFGGNVVRLLISLVILAVTFYIDKFDFYASIAGLLTLKIVLIGFVALRYIFFKDKVGNSQLIEEKDSVKEEIIDDVTI